MAGVTVDQFVSALSRQNMRIQQLELLLSDQQQQQAQQQQQSQSQSTSGSASPSASSPTGASLFSLTHAHTSLPATPEVPDSEEDDAPRGGAAMPMHLPLQAAPRRRRAASFAIHAGEGSARSSVAGSSRRESVESYGEMSSRTRFNSLSMSLGRGAWSPHGPPAGNNEVVVKLLERVGEVQQSLLALQEDVEAMRTRQGEQETRMVEMEQRIAQQQQQQQAPVATEAATDLVDGGAVATLRSDFERETTRTKQTLSTLTTTLAEVERTSSTIAQQLVGVMSDVAGKAEQDEVDALAVDVDDIFGELAMDEEAEEDDKEEAVADETGEEADTAERRPRRRKVARSEAPAGDALAPHVWSAARQQDRAYAETLFRKVASLVEDRLTDITLEWKARERALTGSLERAVRRIQVAHKEAAPAAKAAAPKELESPSRRPPQTVKSPPVRVPQQLRSAVSSPDVRGREADDEVALLAPSSPMAPPKPADEAPAKSPAKSPSAGFALPPSPQPARGLTPPPQLAALPPSPVLRRGGSVAQQQYVAQQQQTHMQQQRPQEQARAEAEQQQLQQLQQQQREQLRQRLVVEARDTQSAPVAQSPPGKGKGQLRKKRIGSKPDAGPAFAPTTNANGLPVIGTMWNGIE